MLTSMRLGEKSDAPCALTAWRDQLYLAWTGTDLHLNVASSADGRAITGKQRLAEVSYKRVTESSSDTNQSSTTERSALHVLATGQDPPRPVGVPENGTRPQASQFLRDLVTQMDPYPGALTDEMWTIRFRNHAMGAWAGGWYDRVPPEEQNLILYLFSRHSEDVLSDVHAQRRFLVAVLRYQYTRNIASPRFADLVSRLIATGDEAAELWERHEVEMPPHEYRLRVRHSDHGLVEAGVALMPVNPKLWLYTMVLPKGIKPPAPHQP